MRKLLSLNAIEAFAAAARHDGKTGWRVSRMVNAPPVLAMGWQTPRLPDFYASQPGWRVDRNHYCVHGIKGAASNAAGLIALLFAAGEQFRRQLQHYFQ